MKLTQMEFLLGLRELEFPNGGARDVWKLLDRNSTGSIMYHQFDPKGAQQLAALVDWAETTFGGLQLMFKALDVDKSGSLKFAEFAGGAAKHGLQVGFERVDQLFQMVDG